MFNTMTQEDCSASVDTHDSIRRILSRLDGVVQIKDDIMVKGEGEAHDRQFENVFERLQHHKITLNFDKCHLGLTEIKWFQMIYSKESMSKDLTKIDHIAIQQPPCDKDTVKSFLQTKQFCRAFLKLKTREMRRRSRKRRRQTGRQGLREKLGLIKRRGQWRSQWWLQPPLL